MENDTTGNPDFAECPSLDPVDCSGPSDGIPEAVERDLASDIVGPSAETVERLQSDATADQPGSEHQGTTGPTVDNAEVSTISLTSSVPPPKRYAHHGKRRRSYTEEMFRCQCVDKISRSDLVCNALLWKNRPETLREHLLEHLTVDQVWSMTDDKVIQWYSEAKRIFLQGIPEDCDDSEDEGDPEDV